MPKVTAVALAATALMLAALTACAEAPAEAHAVPERAAAVTAAELEYLDVVVVTADRTDEELLEAARIACEQISSGRDIFQVHVFDDDTNDGGFYEDSVRVALAAAPRICPSAR